MDLRVAIGTLFSLFGAILTIYGVVAKKAIFAISLGINVDLYWGIVMLVFGVLMLTFGLRSQRTATPAMPDPTTLE